MASSPKHHHHHPRAGAAKQQQQQQQARGANSKQRPLALRRAMLHSCVCFLLGLLTGLAPSDWMDAAATFRPSWAMMNSTAAAAAAAALGHLLTLQHSYYLPAPYQHQPPPLDLVVVVTTTAASERERRWAGLTRTAHALRLVPPPVVWLVVEAAVEAGPTARLLRRSTGVVAYRHITYGGGENFTSESEERRHQRNQALAHIERHRLRGVVLFAGLADVYDLRLLDQLRRHIRSRSVGSWAVATVWEKTVAVEGPVVVGCNTTTTTTTSAAAAAAAGTCAWFSSSFSSSSSSTTTSSAAPPVMADDAVHGFAFASDLLWDPARWDRFPTTEPDQSQDSIKFVQRLVVAEYNKTRPIPDGYSNGSQIMVWRVDTTLL